jgi:hypothetical protein
MMAARFDVRAHAEPQTLARLINYMAQQGMVPRRIHAREAKGIMTVVIDQPDIAGDQANIIAEKMRASVLVESVRLSLHPPRQSDGRPL